MVLAEDEVKALMRRELKYSSYKNVEKASNGRKTKHILQRNYSLEDINLRIRDKTSYCSEKETQGPETLLLIKN